MLKKRLIPKLQIKRVNNSQILVTTINFSKILEIGSPVSQARIYEANITDELIIIDLDATKESRLIEVDLIKRISEVVFMPVTVGGGIRTLNDIEILLKAGADKISVNYTAFSNPNFVKDSALVFGSQCIVVSIDYKIIENKPIVFVNNGIENTGLLLYDAIKKFEELGAGELLITSIDRDGTKKGLDIETISQCSTLTSIPLIASGGCGLASHFTDGFLKSNVNAIASGTFFSFQDQSIIQTRAHIKNAGIPIRTLT